jgi:hypothetical protein
VSSLRIESSLRAGKNHFGGKMKKLLLLCFLVVLWALPKTILATDELPWEKKLPFKSAIVHYAISGMEEGEETLYLRDNGSQQATYHETVSKMMGMEMSNSTVELKTLDYIYSYDLQTREGSQVSNPKKYMMEEYNKLSADEKKKVRLNSEKMGTAYTEGMGGKIQQNATEILGYSCDKMEIMGGGSTYLIHNTDIPLKTEMNMMGMKMSMVATSVEEGDVDDKFFQQPAGIHAEMDPEADMMARAMARQVMANLKDPENAQKSEVQSAGFPEEKEGMSEEDKLMMEQVQKMMQGMKGTLGQ